MSEKLVSDQQEKVLIENIDFKCPSCASCFSEESQWITNLLESKTTTCPNCGSELLLGAEEEGLLAALMKKKERFGKAMFVFMVPYAIGGLIVSLYFGGLGFMLYMPVGLVIFSLLKMLFDNQPDLTIGLNQAS